MNEPLSTNPVPIISASTVDRLNIFLTEHPEQQEYLIRKINESVNDILTIADWLVKVEQFAQHGGGQ